MKKDEDNPFEIHLFSTQIVTFLLLLTLSSIGTVYFARCLIDDFPKVISQLKDERSHGEHILTPKQKTVN